MFPQRIDGTRIQSLAQDNGIPVESAYRYIHEARDMIASQACTLNDAQTRYEQHHAHLSRVAMTDPSKSHGAPEGVNKEIHCGRYSGYKDRS